MFDNFLAACQLSAAPLDLRLRDRWTVRYERHMNQGSSFINNSFMSLRLHVKPI